MWGDTFPLPFSLCLARGAANLWYFLNSKHRSVAVRNILRSGITSDVRSILEKVNAMLEDAIRENPEQYAWGHRRWRD
jgi:lauroyl/myristoyl acyltransferase